MNFKILFLVFLPLIALNAQVIRRSDKYFLNIHKTADNGITFPTGQFQKQLLRMFDIYVEEKLRIKQARRNKTKLYKICLSNLRLSTETCSIHRGDEIENNLPVNLDKMSQAYDIEELDY